MGTPQYTTVALEIKMHTYTVQDEFVIKMKSGNLDFGNNYWTNTSEITCSTILITFGQQQHIC